MIEARGVMEVGCAPAATSVEILKGIDILVPQGQFVAIMGSSGSGQKHAAWSARRPRLARLKGQVLVDGVDITHLARR